MNGETISVSSNSLSQYNDDEENDESVQLDKNFLIASGKAAS